MFQSVMDPGKRRNLGAYYTSERNILKVVRGLFLDDLYREYEAVKDNLRKLNRFHERIARLRFLDPACGCVNFLIIAYRELRRLEIAVLTSAMHMAWMRQVCGRLKSDYRHSNNLVYNNFPWPEAPS
jgi:hypothetical protein